MVGVDRVDGGDGFVGLINKMECLLFLFFVS